MVAKGREESPEIRCKDSASSAVLTVRSVKGMPRPLSNARAESQGPHLLAVYSVTGYLLLTWRSSKGKPVLEAAQLAPTPVPTTLP